MQVWLLVGFGSFIGGVLRYGTGVLLAKMVSSNFPLSTFLINILGSFVIGLIYGLNQREILSDNWRYFLATGICGGFTTFSSFSYETMALLKNQFFLTAFLYISLSVLLGLAGVVAGFYIGRSIGN